MARLGQALDPGRGGRTVIDANAASIAKVPKLRRLVKDQNQTWVVTSLPVLDRRGGLCGKSGRLPTIVKVQTSHFECRIYIQKGQSVSDDHRRAEFNAKVVEFTRQLRNEAEVWPIFERVGFREYFSMEEIRFLHRRIPQIAPRQAADRPIKSLDWMISFGLLGRLADGLIVDSDLDGKWVSGFIIDRWHVPSVERNGLRQSGGWRPVELGWVMALAREIAKDPSTLR